MLIVGENYKTFRGGSQIFNGHRQKNIYHEILRKIKKKIKTIGNVHNGQ